jgi:hypothetical protein
MPNGDAAPDRSFAKVLASKAVDRIVPEAIQRLEAGRRLYLKQAASSAEAELALLNEERERIRGEDGQDPRLARLDRLIGAVEAERADARAVLAEIERAIVPAADGWTIYGRVLARDGSVPRGVEVVFLDERGEPNKDLGALKPDGGGAVRQVVAGDLVKRLAAQNAQVAAAARAGGRVVATDERRALVRAGGLYQFDLRIDPGINR